MQSVSPVMALHNVTKAYDAGTTQVLALNSVDLSVARGEILLVMGPSGSGKTTLLLIAGGLLRPTSGTVLIEGRDIAGMSDAELSRLRRKKIGFVFQSFNLLSALTAQENVEVVLGLSGVGKKEASDRAGTLP